MDWRTRLYIACPLLVGFFGFPKRIHPHRVVMEPYEWDSLGATKWRKAERQGY